MLIARGAYAYRRNGEYAGVRESWSIHRDDHGRNITQSARDASAYQSTILVNALTEAGALTTVDIDWRNGAEGMVRKASAAYQFSPGAASLRRNINGVDDTHRFVYSPMPLVSPLLRVFTGAVIMKLADAGAPLDVLVPNITDPADARALLTPKIEKRRAAFLHTEDLSVDGKTIPARCYSYISEQYDDTARFWIDAHQLLVRYTWGSWDVILEQYERAP